jgi:hypothetical protein
MQMLLVFEQDKYDSCDDLLVNSKVLGGWKLEIQTTLFYNGHFRRQSGLKENILQIYFCGVYLTSCKRKTTKI